MQCVLLGNTSNAHILQPANKLHLTTAYHTVNLGAWTTDILLNVPTKKQT